MIRIKIGMPGTKRGANVVIIDDGKILLLLRSGGWKSNHWGPPGGGVEEEETPKQGAIRETFEETGLSVKSEDLELLIQKTKYDYGMIYFYITDKYSGSDIKLSHEHEDYAWVGLAELDNYKTTFEPDQLSLIKKRLLSQ